MDNTEKLLRLLIDALEFDLEETPIKDMNGDIYLDKEPDLKLTKRKKQVKARKANEPDYTDKFNCLWDRYPKRSGSNCKRKAFSAYLARGKEGQGFNGMMQGVERYILYVKHEGIENTSYVMQASTFLGPSRYYLEEWALPVAKKQYIKVPFEHTAVDAFAKKHGLRYPAPMNMGYPEYKQLLQKEIDAKLGQTND